MSKCEISLEKCLGCPLSQIIPAIRIGEALNTCKLYCGITDGDKVIEITKCIKEA